MSKRKPVPKSKVGKQSIMNVRQVVKKLKLRATRPRAKVTITTIAKQRVHAVDSPKIYIDHPTALKKENRKVVLSQLQGYGNVTKMPWSGSTHGDQVEQVRYKFVQKSVVIPEVVPTVDGTTPIIEEPEVKKLDSQGAEVDTEEVRLAQITVSTSEENGA